jgi:hypothetical protein
VQDDTFGRRDLSCVNLTEWVCNSEAMTSLVWSESSYRNSVASRRLPRLVRSNTEDRKCRGDSLEFLKRCILVHRHMGSRSRRSLQVSSQDRTTLVGGDLFEMDLLTTAAPENRSSTGGTHVLRPLHVTSKLDSESSRSSWVAARGITIA